MNQYFSGSKTAMSIVIAILSLSVPSFSHSGEEERSIAGVAPDSIFYGLDVFMDDMSLFFTFDEKAKAEKAIAVARERLFETKVMVGGNKAEAAKKAAAEYDDSIKAASSAVAKLERSDSEAEIRDMIEIEKRFGEHEIEAEDVKKELRLAAENRPDKSVVDSIINSISFRHQELEIEIENEVKKVKIKIKAETGKTEDEIEDELERMRGREKGKVTAEITGNATRVRIETRFFSNSTDRNVIAQEILNKLKLGSSEISSLIRIEDQREFRADMSGRNEVPAVQTIAGGRARFELENETIKFRVEVSGIENVTASHIHLAPAGQSGPVVVTLFSGLKDGLFNGILSQGNATSSSLAGPLAGQTLSGLVARMTSGDTYVNVHTRQHPAGEIRGQIMAEQEEARERLEAEAKPGKEVKAEFRFFVTETERAGIIEAVSRRLASLTLDDILIAMEDGQKKDAEKGNGAKRDGVGENEAEDDDSGSGRGGKTPTSVKQQTTSTAQQVTSTSM